LAAQGFLDPRPAGTPDRRHFARVLSMLAGFWRQPCQERKVELKAKEIKQERMGPVSPGMPSSSVF
ncbi:hypothetical protein LB570_20605, partial [Mesorhizobium sp. BR1-1-5]|nr:hypothetical protein [Mesorhizobium sp. BR1-1-5]